MSVHFQLELNTQGFLSVPTDKNPKDRGQHIAGLYFENHFWTYTEMNSFPFVGVANSEVCPSIVDIAVTCQYIALVTYLKTETLLSCYQNACPKTDNTSCCKSNTYLMGML